MLNVNNDCAEGHGLTLRAVLPMRRTVIAGGIAILAASTLLPNIAGAAAPFSRSCIKAHQQCTKKCDKRSIGQDICYRRCDVALMNCDSASPSKNEQTPPEPRHPRGTDNSAPPTGGNKPEPNKPPKPRNDAPPTGGTKADPKPPRADNPRAPMGGGVFQPNPKTPSNSGPIILRSGGMNQPSTKPGGGSGASMRSNGRK